jgi:predicted Zn-dependent protease
MLAQSFRFVAVLPAHRGRLAAGALTLTVAIIVAGCGGSGKRQGEIVAGTGFRFSAPAGWTVQRSAGSVTAARGDVFVRVSTFPLAKPYSAGLFAKVASELRLRMSALAAQSGGKVEGTGEVIAAGIRAHVWRIGTGGDLDEYTFVLKGRREYQLLCRRSANGDDAPCKQLVTTFRLS